MGCGTTVSRSVVAHARRDQEDDASERHATKSVCITRFFSRFFTSLHFFTLTFSGMQCFLVHFASRLKLSIKRRLPNR